jgi:hypothetical protein
VPSGHLQQLIGAGLADTDSLADDLQERRLIRRYFLECLEVLSGRNVVLIGLSLA